jgi:hypothetical protein
VIKYKILLLLSGSHSHRHKKYDNDYHRNKQGRMQDFDQGDNYRIVIAYRV